MSGDALEQFRRLRYVEMRDELAAERAEVERLRAEVERLEKRLQACQSNDDYALTDDCITQNERFLLADNERLCRERQEAADKIEELRAERDAERQHADRLAEVLRIVVRDWCPSSTRVPILDEHEAHREQ